MRALLVSTYELGRQPFGLASPAAWLRREGFDVACVDAGRDRLTPDIARRADLVAFYLPMHTATRLAAPLIGAVKALNPSARVSAYGLYAPLNAQWLRDLGVDDILGGEFEADLAAIAREMQAGRRQDLAPIVDAPGRGPLPRLKFLVPDRSGLPPLNRYATLELGDGKRKVVGYTEASRGCRHLCRHCPVVPIYQGQFRVVQPEIVQADIAAQVAAGAEHITFGDPDFFNGPTHAMHVIDTLHREHPGLTYDLTIKVEHLLKYRDLLPRLRATGCAFVTTAVESIDDRVLAILEKGHTRRDFLDAVAVTRDAGVALVPTFVAFHPWMTLADYCGLLETVDALDLVESVAPVQLAVRLLIPEGSRLLELEDVRRRVEPFNPQTLTYRWTHEDPEVDRLHDEVTAYVGQHTADDRHSVFEEIRRMAHVRAGLAPASSRSRLSRVTVPRLSEPWYCCAEPSPEQLV